MERGRDSAGVAFRQGGILAELKPPTYTSHLHPALQGGSGFGGADEVGEQAVAGGFDAGVVFDERNSKDIEIKTDGGTGAFEAGHGVGHQEKLRADTGIHTVAAAFGAAYQLVTHASGAHGADLFFAEIANAGALHLLDAQRHAHQHIHDGGDFHGRVPAIEVVRGIGFRDAHGLRALHGFLERTASFDIGEDDIGSGIQNARKAAEIGGGKAEGKQGKDGRAIHDRGFEQELPALFPGQRGDALIVVDQGSFVGSDGMSAGFERGDEMVDGGLAVLHVERTGFEKHIRFAAFEPFADVLRRVRDLREMPGERGNGIQALGIGNPADAARGDAGEAPAEIVFAAEFTFFGDEQTQ